MFDCCKPILFGWFKNQKVYKVGMRHSKKCMFAGQINGIHFDRWYWDGRAIPNGEVYS